MRAGTVGFRPHLQAVLPPLREARSQSFMKWRSSRICAPEPTSDGRCSLAWWPQKNSWPPEGIVARTQARAPQASQRFAAFSCGPSRMGRSRVCAFMLPSHTMTPPRAPLFTRGAITSMAADAMGAGRKSAGIRVSRRVKRRSTAQFVPGLAHRGKRPRTRATRTVARKRARGHI